ncbi:MAG: secondary thiamine-phosphate synthase enzyme YjbQ [Candidatus Omnitrophota bacterium]
MKIITKSISLKTRGAGDLINITSEIEALLSQTALKEGNVTVFVVGSTAGITSFEYESGLIKDMKDIYEKLAPSTKQYAHDETWHDANGFSHVRAALQGPSMTVPFENNRLSLGTWQQIVLAEFDNRSRTRKVIIQFMGE